MRQNRCFACMIFVPLFLLSVVSTGLCGLVMLDADGSRTLVSQGVLKSIPADSDEEQMIFDLKKETILVINKQERKAFQGTVDEYCELMQNMRSMMAQGMQHMSDGSMSDMSDTSYPNQSGEKTVRVESLGSGEEISGYATEKYAVYVNDELAEEVWTSRDEELLEELGDADVMIRFMACASQMMGGNSVESDPEYKKMLKSGWMLKSIEHEEGYAEIIVEVRSIEQRDISSSEFEIPSGYTRMSLGRLFGME